MIGTHDSKDNGLLSFGGSNLGQTVLEYGEQAVADETQELLNVYNVRAEEFITELCVLTEDRMALYTGVPSLKMDRGNEYSQPLVQKPGIGTTMGFKIEKGEIGIGFTRRKFETMALRQYRNVMEGILLADKQWFEKQIKNAVFNPANTPNFVDEFGDGFQFDVYTFHNGDNKRVAMRKDGTPAAINHQHYMFATAWSASNIRNTINNVREHMGNDSIVVYINAANVNDFKQLQASGDFNSYLIQGVVPSANTTFASGGNYRPGLTESAIGLFDDVEVQTRSWVPAGYMAVIDKGTPTEKALAYRVLPGGQYSDLGIRFHDEKYPLRADYMDRFGGVSAKDRSKVAVCYFNAGATAYVKPAGLEF